MKSFHTVFCAAIPMEVKALCRRLAMPLPTEKDPVSHGKFRSVNVTVLVSGVGIGRMGRRLACVQPMTQTCWISYGLAGALSSQYRVGDCIFGRRVQYPHHDEIQSAWGLEWGVEWGLEEVCLLCHHEVIGTPQDKQRVYQETGAALVDMESYAVAVTAVNRFEPFFWLRGISDGHDERLQGGLLDCLDGQGYPSAYRAVKQILRHPALIPHALHIGKTVQRIQTRLAARAVQFLEALDTV